MTIEFLLTLQSRGFKKVVQRFPATSAAGHAVALGVALGALTWPTVGSAQAVPEAVTRPPEAMLDRGWKSEQGSDQRLASDSEGGGTYCPLNDQDKLTVSADVGTNDMIPRVLELYKAEAEARPGNTESCQLDSRQQNIKEGLQSVARRLGYVLSRVTSEGPPEAAKFVLNPGRLTCVLYSSQPGKPPTAVHASIRALGSALLSGDSSRAFNLSDLESFLLKVQDIPGVTVQSLVRRVRSGDGTNAAEVVVGGGAGNGCGLPGLDTFLVELTVRHSDLSGFVSMDNSGPLYAGPFQLSAGIAWNTPVWRIQRADVTAFTTRDKEQRYGQLGLLGLLDSHGTRLRLQAGYGESLPSGDLSVAGFRSTVSSVLTQVQVPVVRSRRQNFIATGSFELFEADIDIKGAGSSYSTLTESRLRILRAAAAYDRLDSSGLTTAEAELAVGLDAFGATDTDSILTPRPDSRSDFHRLSAQVGRKQGLFSGDLYSVDLSLSVRGQYAFDILPPSQKLLLGGERGVRGYDLGQLSGDHGVVGTAELSWRYSTMTFEKPGYVTLFGFYDYGTIWEIAPFDQPRRQIHSVGLGVRGELDRRVQAGATVSQRLILNPTKTNLEPLAKQRFVASLLYRF